MTITTLAHGSHQPSDGKMCMMEAVSFLAGEQFSDEPECVSPVIATFCRNWNDGLEQEARDRLLLPLLQDVIGTRTTDADDEVRKDMALDWLVCVHAPAFMDLTPELRPHTDALRSLSPSRAVVSSAGAAAGAAAWDAAWDAAGAAAWDAARDAACDAARVAYLRGIDLTPTVAMLQESAVDLLKRMCAVGRQNHMGENA